MRQSAKCLRHLKGTDAAGEHGGGGRIDLLRAELSCQKTNQKHRDWRNRQEKGTREKWNQQPDADFLSSLLTKSFTVHNETIPIIGILLPQYFFCKWGNVISVRPLKDENRSTQSSVKCDLTYKSPEYALSEDEGWGSAHLITERACISSLEEDERKDQKPNKTHREQIAHTIKTFSWFSNDQNNPF